MMQRESRPIEERIEDSDVDAEHAFPPTGEAKSGEDIHLAVPAQYGDKISIHYPEDADVRFRSNPEEWVFAGLRCEMVKLVRFEQYEKAVERSDDEDFVDIYGSTAEGIFRFNNRVLNVAEKVCVERLDGPEYLSVR